MRPYLLLTGATGFIGQYLLRRFLLRDVPIVVVVRGDSTDSARARVDAVVEGFEREEGRSLARPICFTGDITREMLGLDEFAVEWFEGNCGRVLHNAASIRFHAPNGDRTKDPWLSNRDGTRHVLDLCRATGIEEFHHVSTAYVSGKRIRETFYENQLDCGQEFVNDYQASKLEAETAIREASFLKSKTFYRPALVVGDSRNGFTTAPDFGLYYYIQFNVEIMKRLRKPGDDSPITIPFRLRFTGNERRNIVTVDWVADMIVHILTHPEYHNQTYHLTPQRASSSRDIIQALQDYFNYSGIEFIGTKEIPASEQTDIERFFYDFVTTFESYWEDEPVFDRTNTDRVSDGIVTPPIDQACLHRLIDFAVRYCFVPKATEKK